MKKSIGLLIGLNRRAILLLGISLSLAVFGFVTLRTKAQSPEGSDDGGPGNAMQPANLTAPAGPEIACGPAARPDSPSSITFAKALIYDDFANPGPYQTALTNLGIPFTDFTSNFAGFNAALPTANPLDTLVIVDDGNNLRDWDNSNLNAFVNNGGRVIFFYWDLDANGIGASLPFPTTVTKATFQTSDAITFGEAPSPNDVPLPVYNWGGSSLFNGLPNTLFPSQNFFFDNGDKLQPSGGAIALGGFTPAPAPNQAAIISGHQGRTLIQGFSLDEVPGNLCMGSIVATNEIQSVAAGTNIPFGSFVIDDVNKNEGNSGTTAFTFTVSRLGPLGFPATVQFETRDGSATVANNDYQPVTGVLNFGFFETSKTITVLVNGDTAIEPNETFTVHILSNPVSGSAQDGDGTGTIINDDFPPTPTPVPTPTPTPPNRFEGDINRTAAGVPGTGDGDVNVADQIQFLKFLKGTDCPSLNEQPRLDAGPRLSPTNVVVLGDGTLGIADGTAIDAYARHDKTTDFDPNTVVWDPTPAGGNATITNLGPN
ncbi:MAG TPA: Calx-beta domain-containing protein, partial [Pyrinomonadaceae bacterium]|nr:Calx-beta domain-containing protein [Pyrinomonadaceae bacterium]